MRNSPRTSVLLLLALSLAACSQDGNEAGSDGGDLFVETCSLGCTSGQGGSQILCSIVNAYQNQEISILFSEPVDPQSVNASSFRVVKVATGTTPVGTFLIDAVNPKKLIFRPSLSFGPSGNPEFGLEATREILRRRPEVPVVILSVHDESAYVEAAFEAGARA